MKTPIIIVEGNTDKMILSRFLAKEVRDIVEFGVANGSTAAQALARSILSTNVRPVVLVMDTDTTDERRIAEIRELVEYSLREASSGSPYKLCLAIPTIEALLVQDERALASLGGGREIQPFELDYARQNPKQYLRERFRCGADYALCLSKVLANLSPDVTFEDDPRGVAKEIVDFVRSAGAPASRSNTGFHADAGNAPRR